MTDTSAGFGRALTSDKLKTVHEVWKELASGRVGPKRDEITPARLRGATPFTFTIDVIDGGKDFRFRIAGDRIIQFLGGRMAGTLLSERRGTPFFDAMHQLYESCVTTRAPVAIGPLAATYPGKEFLEIEVLILPLSEDGETVTALFGAFESWQLGTHASAG